RIGGDDLMAFYIGATEDAGIPARRSQAPEEQRCLADSVGGAWRKKGPVIIIDERVVPCISFEALIAVINFPGIFSPRLAQRESCPITRVTVGGRGRVMHIFASHF